MAHQEAGAHHAHRTADDEYLPVAGSSYEHTDANVWAIVKFGLWLAVTAVIVHLGIGLMFSMLVEQATETTEQRYPLAVGVGPTLPPEPRLQQFPRTEIYELRMSEDQRLNGYGWVDRDGGRVHIPVAEAMRLIVERGLPARAEDAENPASPPGMSASDASAGRLMERRRQ